MTTAVCTQILASASMDRALSKDPASSGKPLLYLLSQKRTFVRQGQAGSRKRVFPSQSEQNYVSKPRVAKGTMVTGFATSEGIIMKPCLSIADRYSQPDLIIAAKALRHCLTILTRNLNDFEKARVPVFNPWDITKEGEKLRRDEVN